MTAGIECATAPRVGRKKKNFDDQMAARFPEGTFVRIERVLVPGETRTDLVQMAVEAELERRERKRSDGGKS